VKRHSQQAGFVRPGINPLCYVYENGGGFYPLIVWKSEHTPRLFHNEPSAVIARRLNRRNRLFKRKIAENAAQADVYFSGIFVAVGIVFTGR
jgi:hypothetical protein